MKTLHDGTSVPLDTPTKNTSEGRFLLTPAEVSAREAGELEYTKSRPLAIWQSVMQASDAAMPRALEDIIDALDAPTRARIAPATLDKYEDKVALRNSRPVV